MKGVKVIKIITVCGLGVGSSLILKMTVDSAMSQLKIPCSIEHWDMGTIKGQSCDLIVTTEGFRDNFVGDENVLFVKNIVDVEEAKSKLKAYFEEKNLF